MKEIGLRKALSERKPHSSTPATQGNSLLALGEISAEWKYKSGKRKVTRD